MKAASASSPEGQTFSCSLHFSPQGSALCVCLRRSHVHGWSLAHSEHTAALSEGQHVLAQEISQTSKLCLVEQQGRSSQT